MPVNPWNQILQPVAGGANAPPVPPGWQNPGAALGPAFSGMPPQAAAYLNSLAASRRPPAAAQGFQNFGAQGQLAGAGPAPPGGYSPAIYNSPNERGMLSDENFAGRMNAGVRPQDVNLADLERYMFPNAPGMGVATEATPMPGVSADLYLSNPGHFQQYRDVSPMHEALPMMMRLGQMATQNQQANQQWQLGLGQLGLDTGRLGATVENQRAQNSLALAQELRNRTELQFRMSPAARQGQAELMQAQGVANGTIQPQQLRYINSTLRDLNMFQPFNIDMPPLPQVPGVNMGPSSPLSNALSGRRSPLGIQPEGWQPQPAPTQAQALRDSQPPIGATGGQPPQGSDVPGQLMNAFQQSAQAHGGNPFGQERKAIPALQVPSAITHFVSQLSDQVLQQNTPQVFDFMIRNFGPDAVNAWFTQRIGGFGAGPQSAQAQAIRRIAAAANARGANVGINPLNPQSGVAHYLNPSSWFGRLGHYHQTGQ